MYLVVNEYADEWDGVAGKGDQSLRHAAMLTISKASIELRYLGHLCYQELRSSEQERNLAPVLSIDIHPE